MNFVAANSNWKRSVTMLPESICSCSSLVQISLTTAGFLLSVLDAVFMHTWR